MARGSEVRGRRICHHGAPPISDLSPSVGRGDACVSLPRYFRSLEMNRVFAFAMLSVALVLGSAGNANAFFGLGGGGCGGCCESSCGCESSCACEPSCSCDSGCESGCGGGCCLFGGLRGMFHRHNNCCCEASCGCEEPSCEATCAAEPSCGCEDSCCESSCCSRPCCPILGCLKGLFHRNHCGCGCESSCGCEPSCGCDSGCGCN